jgi:hypothetical protein
MTMNEQVALRVLYDIAQRRAPDAKELVRCIIADVKFCCGAPALDTLLCQFRDLPVDNDIASFIFKELEGHVLRRPVLH